MTWGVHHIIVVVYPKGVCDKWDENRQNSSTAVDSENELYRTVYVHAFTKQCDVEYSQKCMWKTQCAALDFCMCVGYSPFKTNELMQTAYENECLSRSAVMNCHKKYSDGREMIGKVWEVDGKKTAVCEVNVKNHFSSHWGTQAFFNSIIRGDPQKSEIENPYNFNTEFGYETCTINMGAAPVDSPSTWKMYWSVSCSSWEYCWGEWFPVFDPLFWSKIKMRERTLDQKEGSRVKEGSLTNGGREGDVDRLLWLSRTGLPAHLLAKIGGHEPILL